MNKKLDEHHKNITLGNQICNIMFTIFTICRQEATGFTGNIGRKAGASKDFTVTSKDTKYTIKFEDANSICKECAVSCGLEFKKFGPNDPDNWYGTAAPYLDFFVGNKLRYDELRLGHAHMPISRDAQGMKSFPVEKYGLNGSHYILLEGSTFAPEKRSSMAQSMGPMTALLCHIRTSHPLYRKKWTDASKRAMAHIPMIDEILDLIKDKKASEIRGVISLLADIILITTSRQAQRMFFPINMLARMYTLPTTEQGFVIGDGGQPTEYRTRDDLLSFFNVSGHGGYYLYKMVSHFKWEMEGHFSNSEASQVLFHTIFGTYKEDLSLFVPNNQNWNLVHKRTVG